MSPRIWLNIPGSIPFSWGKNDLVKQMFQDVTFSLNPFKILCLGINLKTLMNFLLTSLTSVKILLVFLNKMYYSKCTNTQNNIFMFIRVMSMKYTDARFWENSPHFMNSKLRKICFVSKCCVDMFYKQL